MTDQTKLAVSQATASPLRAVKGMNDLLPDDMRRWMWIESVVAGVFQRFGYRAIRTPIVEPTALFVRGIGEVTDIVEKEMYSFTDALNGEALTLRPENTAAVVRAAIEHSLLYDGPQRLWYFGPMFRHERPQKGRYRQFYQFGVEALGFDAPEVDAELLILVAQLWDALGIPKADQPRLLLNSLGLPAERAAHREALQTYFRAHAAVLDAEATRRLETNPLRILDSKNPEMADVIAGAPQLSDFWGERSRAHLARVQEMLDAEGIAYTIQPRLVRGLDYYSLTVFEWVTDRLGAQGTVCGGGRYDGLSEMLGGKPSPAIGMALGVERLLALLDEISPPQLPRELDVYMVPVAEGSLAPAVHLASALRRAGMRVHVPGAVASLKSQMKRAGGSQSLVAVILGDAELAAGQATIKNLSTGEQTTVPLGHAPSTIQSIITSHA